MKNFENIVVLILFTYPVGVVIGLVFWALRLVGVLEVKGWSHFPHWRQKVLVVSNHPYEGEQFLLIGLFFHEYVFRPFKYGPWSLADKKNYYDKPKYRLMRPRLIPVDRTLANGDSGSLKVAKKVLASGANLILFPEGGRTSKGESFLTSQKGKRIRPLKGGFAVLAAESGAIVVPMWFEFKGWSGIRLTIGEQQDFSGASREEVVEETGNILLKLADMTG